MTERQNGRPDVVHQYAAAKLQRLQSERVTAEQVLLTLEADIERTQQIVDHPEAPLPLPAQWVGGGLGPDGSTPVAFVLQCPVCQTWSTYEPVWGGDTLDQACEMCRHQHDREAVRVAWCKALGQDPDAEG